MKWWEKFPDFTTFTMEGMAIPWPIHSEDCAMDPKDEAAKLVDWRLGVAVEAAARMIAASINNLAKSLDAQNTRWDRIAGAMERANVFHEQEVELRRDGQQVMDEAKRMMGLLSVGPFSPDPPPPSRRAPEWVQDIVEDPPL